MAESRTQVPKEGGGVLGGEVIFKKKESIIKIDEKGAVTIQATIKDAAIAFFGLAQFLMENGISEVQVKLNLDAAVKQLKKNKRLTKQLN